jgi:hypothetical protein
VLGEAAERLRDVVRDRWLLGDDEGFAHRCWSLNGYVTVRDVLHDTAHDTGVAKRQTPLKSSKFQAANDKRVAVESASRDGLPVLYGYLERVLRASFIVNLLLLQLRCTLEKLNGADAAQCHLRQETTHRT